MKVDEFVLKRLNELIEEAHELIAHHHEGPLGPYVIPSGFASWRTRCLNALDALLGDDSLITKEFDKQITSTLTGKVEQGLGMLVGLAKDVEAGYLASIENMIAAAVFTDFLDMAEQLLDHEHGHVPAATLVGGVLEDSLRRLADSKGVSYKPTEGIGGLNGKLRNARAYNDAQAKEISLWKASRDKAAHGEFEEVEPERVRDMLTGVQRFVATHMT